MRKELIRRVRQQFFGELNLAISLGQKLKAPLCFGDAVGSFSQIFIQNEYTGAFSEGVLPVRWIDFGCHNGYFSLYLQWLHRKSGSDSQTSALLVDADPASRESVAKLIAMNRLADHFTFVHGAIARGSGSVMFAVQDHMRSSLASYCDVTDQTAAVEILSAAKILDLFPPPYDLIKVDIEGAEYELLLAYRDVLKHARRLILEWHSWHPGEGGKDQIAALALEQGFLRDADLVAAQPIEYAGATAQCGVFSFHRPGDKP